MDIRDRSIGGNDAFNRTLSPAQHDPVLPDTNKDHVTIQGTPGEDLDKKLRELRQGMRDSTQAGEVATQSSETPDQGKTVKIGTWNLSWIGGRKRVALKTQKEKDYQAIAGIISQSGAQIMALQEIASEQALKRVLKYLPDFDYVMGTTGTTKDGKIQNLAFIYDRTKVTCEKETLEEIRDVQVPDVIGDTHLRAPLAVRMKADEFDFTIVDCHMKAGFDEQALTIRKAQAERLTAWLEKRLASDKDKDIIILGDLNDFWGSDSMVKMEEKVHFVTDEAVVRGDYTNIKYLSLIDHIGVSEDAMEEYIKGSTNTPEWMDDEKFVKRISDHKPIFCLFRIDRNEDGLQ